MERFFVCVCVAVCCVVYAIPLRHAAAMVLVVDVILCSGDDVVRHISHSYSGVVDDDNDDDKDDETHKPPQFTFDAKIMQIHLFRQVECACPMYKRARAHGRAMR